MTHIALDEENGLYLTYKHNGPCTVLTLHMLGVILMGRKETMVPSALPCWWMTLELVRILIVLIPCAH